MILIDEIIVSSELIHNEFLCQLNSCKGACCWEGDYGAPLESEEEELLAENWTEFKQLLSEESIDLLNKKGVSSKYGKEQFVGTQLHPNGACAFMTKNELGIAQCAIEQAHNLNLIAFQKPIPCHLYPVRVAENEELGFEALNYDRWDICNAACKAGEKANMPVFKFVKNALVRKYGQSFYDTLEEIYKQLNEKD